ncbi:MAG: hypothetical protein WCO56_29475 [Verrucomicrobiota bacterium]
MDYIPPKRNERFSWLKNLSDNVVAEGARFGTTTADATETKALADAILTDMGNTNTADTALKAARLVEKNIEAANLAKIRAKVRNWKTLPGFANSGSEAMLKLKGAPVAFEPATYKPLIKVTIEAGRIQIAFEKLGVDGLAIYMRLRGTANFKRIGVDTDSPYFDTGPLAQPGVPEVREYMARGLIGDDEIGLDSDIVSLTYAG